MNIYSLFFMAGVAISGCGNAAADSTASRNPKQQMIAVDTTKKVSTLPFTDGVTQANRGVKTGNIQLKGKLDQPGVTKKMLLFEMEGKTLIKLDSTSVVNGSFDFGTRNYESGFYAIGPTDQNVMHIILNPAEPVVEIGFRAQKLDANPYAINSKENEAWFKYLPQEKAQLESLKQSRIAMAKTAMKAQFEADILKKETDLANLQGELIKQYPTTFFAKVLTWKQEPVRGDIGKYWNNLDFSDRSVIHTLVLQDRIQNFMRNYSDGKEDGYMNCVDKVVEHAKANEDVLEFSLYSMLSGFYESGMENISAYIADNYIHGEGCGDHEVTNLLKSNTDAIMNLRVGKTPPNIKMTTLDNKSFDLFETCAKNKYTLVMYWASWCEHCKGEAPEVVSYYNLWKPKGLEILGVSVDNNPMAWEQAVEQRGFIFPQVCGMKQWESKVAKDYKVTKTPTFFLLDPSGKIVLKPKGIREVNQWLSQNMK
ncbi:MAG: TlpA disulfide reductase family protein [Flavobacteriales bacterium]|nr:TlpA disulfide reductase family protein [Flavobacteriales bacterium]